jgi:signal peptidase II
MSGLPSAGRPSARRFWSAALVVIVLDFVSKRLAERFLFPPHVPHEIIGDVVRFTLAYNPGAAFSMSLGPYSRYIFGAFALIALVVLWKLYRESRSTERLKVLGLGLAWGGAAGNLIDRLRSPLGVVDFIDIGVGATRFWTFNVADSAVTVGAVALGWVLLQEDREQRRQRGAAPPATSSDAP